MLLLESSGTNLLAHPETTILSCANPISAIDFLLTSDEQAHASDEMACRASQRSGTLIAPFELREL
jgi:hypothetical protein